MNKHERETLLLDITKRIADEAAEYENPKDTTAFLKGAIAGMHASLGLPAGITEEDFAAIAHRMTLDFTASRNNYRDALFAEKLSEGQPPDAILEDVWAGRDDEVATLWKEAEQEANQWLMEMTAPFAAKTHGH